MKIREALVVILAELDRHREALVEIEKALIADPDEVGAILFNGRFHDRATSSGGAALTRATFSSAAGTARNVEA